MTKAFDCSHICRLGARRQPSPDNQVQLVLITEENSWPAAAFNGDLAFRNPTGNDPGWLRNIIIMRIIQCPEYLTQANKDIMGSWREILKIRHSEF